PLDVDMLRPRSGISVTAPSDGVDPARIQEQVIAPMRSYLETHNADILNKLKVDVLRAEGQAQIVVESRRNGARRRTVIDGSFLASADFNRLRSHAKVFRDLKAPFVLTRQGEDAKAPLATVDAAIARLREQSSKGMTIGRYKGLGEMNAEQLW